MTREPAAAMIEALATYLDGLTWTQTTTVLRGWPEQDTELDLYAGPTISVTEIDAPETAHAIQTEDPVDGSAAIAVALVEATLQVDLWAAYREHLDVAASELADALHNDLPYRPHLYLTAADYHYRDFAVLVVPGARADIDGDSAAVGEWRRTWTLRATIERVVIAPTVALVSATATLDS